MNILVIGSGGREHTLAWKIKKSKKCDNLYIAPGNAGTAQIGQNVAIAVGDFASLGNFVIENNINLIVVGPEAPLVMGIRDYFESDNKYQNIAVVGPGKAGAQLEGSKDFSKRFMERHAIPTAEARTFNASQIEEGLEYLSQQQVPIVLKADGLAAGKGVIIAESVEEAQTTLKEMLIDKKFGEASSKVLVEQFLDGIELSVFVLADGKDYVVLPEAKDYKRIGEGDTGPNTGGMGAVSPVSFANQAFMQKVDETIIKPTVEGLKKDGIPYQGFIFIGLMNVNGNPYVIEYNVRMGDPETQAVIPRVNDDLAELLMAAATGTLAGKSLDISNQTAAAVVMVAGGYPSTYAKGKTITGCSNVTGAEVFHAGTKANNGATVTNGGRVITVTGRGDELEKALENAYKGVNEIKWEGVNFRKDIGKDLIALESN